MNRTFLSAWGTRRRLPSLYAVVSTLLAGCDSAPPSENRGPDGGGGQDAYGDVARTDGGASAGQRDTDASPTDHAGAAFATFTPATCPFPAIPNREIQCGTVVVPEARELMAAGRVELAVVIFKSVAPSPAPDPVVYLAGGPGESGVSTMLSLARAANTSANPLNAFLAKRDVVAIDQRGLGMSRPSLDCPELASSPAQPMMMMEVGDMPAAASVQKCRDRLRTASIDPGRYTTEAAADDIEDVRRALGHTKWNLLGTSYGTRLALEVVRRHPEGLRSVVLDSVLPAQVDWLAETGPNIDGSLNLVFDSCARQPACDKSYPKLREVFLAVAESLDAKPALLDTGNGQVMLTGKLFVSVMSRFLNVSLLIREFPELTFQLRDGNYSFFEQVFRAAASTMPSMMQTGINVGLHLSIICGNDLPFTSAAAIDARAATLSPAVREALTPRLYFDLCPIWGVPSASRLSKDPVSSTMQSLLLAGEYDPTTPPAWATLAGGSLSAARLLELKGESHGIFPTACGKDVVVDFLDDPNKAPAPPCLAALKDLAFSIKR